MADVLFSVLVPDVFAKAFSGGEQVRFGWVWIGRT